MGKQEKVTPETAQEYSSWVKECSSAERENTRESLKGGEDIHRKHRDAPREGDAPECTFVLPQGLSTHGAGCAPSALPSLSSHLWNYRTQGVCGQHCFLALRTPKLYGLLVRNSNNIDVNNLKNIFLGT